MEPSLAEGYKEAGTGAKSLDCTRALRQGSPQSNFTEWWCGAEGSTGRVAAPLGGSGGMPPPENFKISDALRCILVHSRHVYSGIEQAFHEQKLLHGMPALYHHSLLLQDVHAPALQLACACWNLHVVLEHPCAAIRKVRD